MLNSFNNFLHTVHYFNNSWPSNYPGHDYLLKVNNVAFPDYKMHKVMCIFPSSRTYYIIKIHFVTSVHEIVKETLPCTIKNFQVQVLWNMMLNSHACDDCDAFAYCLSISLNNQTVLLSRRISLSDKSVREHSSKSIFSLLASGRSSGFIHSIDVIIRFCNKKNKKNRYFNLHNINKCSECLWGSTQLCFPQADFT